MVPHAPADRPPRDSILNNATRSTAPWIRLASFATLALALAAALAQGGVYRRLELWLEDAQQRALATQLDLGDVVVIDVDEVSMRVLSADLGTWPYQREVYALVSGYLLRSGVRALAYDILFAEERGGDDAFGAAIDERVILAAAALRDPADRSPGFHAQLAAAAIDVAHFGAADTAVHSAPATPPHAAWADLTLPAPTLTRGGTVRIGVISVTPDEDGVLRRVPLLHRAHDKLLPSFPLAALLARTELRPLRYADAMIAAGPLRWPMSAAGDLRLRFPRGVDGLRVIPFHEAVLAAAAAPGHESLAPALRGKTVFVGSSSAMLADHVLTPIGRVSGLKMAALAHQLLLKEQVLRPPSLAWDVALFALAFLPALLGLRSETSARPMRRLAALALALGLTAGGGAALIALGWESHWVLALLFGAILQAMLFAYDTHALQHERQRLHFEKLAAEQASRMRGEFVAHMAHELRTPLTAIMGFTKMNQLGDDLGRERRIENSAIVARNCEHLLRLVSNNLDQARMEAGQLVLDHAPEDIAALVADVVATLSSEARSKQIELRTAAAGSVPERVLVDGWRLRQVLVNLVGNAVKFTAEGSVTVDLRWDDGTLELVVTDTGPGIEAAALERIFEAFQQADATLRAGYGGTGLGLTISRNLVRLMGGTIEVSSRIGEGARFRLLVPAPVAPAVPAPPAEPTQDMLHGRILLVEDQDDIRILLERQLGRIGLAVRGAANGFEALRMMREEGADAVLMDLEMPIMDGYEAIRILRSEGYGGPILALTAHGGSAEQARALALGCQAVLEKPLRADALFAALSRYLMREARVADAVGGAVGAPPAVPLR